jgi:transcriptional regulator with XRE-family HTH domain
MPQISKLQLPLLDLGNETLGQRLARLRKEKGYTQTQLAQKIGIIQSIVSEYERDTRRPHYEMIIRFALALETTTDNLLGLSGFPPTNEQTNSSLKILKRVKKIEQLPASQQKILFKTIDTFLKAAEK